MPSCGAQGERTFLFPYETEPTCCMKQWTDKFGKLWVWTRPTDRMYWLRYAWFCWVSPRKCLKHNTTVFLLSPYAPHSQLPFVFHSHAPTTSAVEIMSLGTSNSIPEYIIYRTIVQTDTRVITAVTVQSMNWGGWCSGVRISLLQATLVQQPI